MSEFKIGAVDYRVGIMPAMIQLHIVRRLAAVVAEIATPEMIKIINERRASDVGEDDAIGLFAEFIGPIGKAVSAMPDKDFEYVVNACLDCTQRGDGGKWFPLRTNGVTMRQDLEPSDMLFIVGNVVAAKLGNFMAALPVDLKLGAPTPALNS